MSDREGRSASGSDEGTADIAAKIRDLRLLVAALAISFVGVLLFIWGWGSEDGLELRSKDSGLTYTTESDQRWNNARRDIGLSLFALGAVGIVYEFFNRQAAEQAANRLFSRTADGIGHRVASDTVSLVAGDKRFIDEILNQEDREVLLKKIILAHLNQDAEELAASTAAQLSGQPILSGYRATYFARDKLNPPHALFEQSLTRHSAPNELFEFVFQVFRSEDTDKFTYGPEVFTWRYWLAPDEDPKTVLKAFVVESVAVNGVPLEDIKLDETHVSSDSVRWTGRYSPQSGKRFLVETKIRLPAPKEASYVHVEPRALSQGFEVSCDVTDSKLDAVAVETVRTRNIRISKSPADLDSGTRRTTQSRTVYTAEWVLPSAAVAYVFYTPTEPYNKPTTTHEAN